MVVELNILSHDALIAAEALLPELITEDNERIFVCDPSLVWSKRSAQSRLQSEGRKVIATNEFDPGAFRLALGAKADGGRRVADEVGKDILKLAIVLKIRVREADRELDIFVLRG